MNLTIDKSAVFASNFHAVTGSKKKKEKQEEITPEQRMIEQFKEEHSRENTKTSDIYYKFRSGQKLTPEELEYLAKESPEMYKEIKEIMMERQAMEEQMERAESKEEVASIHMNQVMTIKKTMGTGEEAERQAEKTMARVNQIGAAFNEYTATAEYKEKEDVKSRAEEQREQLEELERQQELFRDKIAENKAEELEEPSEETEEVTSSGESKDSAVSVDALESDDDKKDDTGIKRRKRGKKAPLPDEKFFRMAATDYKELRQKVRELYHSEKKTVVRSTEGTKSAKSAKSVKSEHSGIDVSL